MTFSDDLGSYRRLPFEADHGKVIEKTLPGRFLECGVVLGIVPFGGAEGIRTIERAAAVISESFQLTFKITTSTFA